LSTALAMGADPASLAGTAGQLDANAKALEVAAVRLKSQAATLTVRQRALDDLDEAIARDTARLVELTEQRTAARAQAGAAADRAAARRAELNAGLGGAPDLAAAIAAARQAADTFSAAADAADAAARAGQDAQAARQRAAQAALAGGFGPAAADAVAAARAAGRDAGWRKEAAASIKRHDAETEAVASLLADPDLAAVELDPPAPVAETAEIAVQAQQAHDAAAAAYGTARHTVEQLTDLQPRLEDALRVLAPLQEQAEQVRQLADLAAGLGANQYKMTLSSFVLAARLEEVAVAASQRLLAMSSGRYSLAHSDARKGNARAGLSLLVCDAWTGRDRETATLSGGETFQASLALALGLADVVTAEAAGTPMEALFVDEGFGTLDEDALDEVLNVLDSLRAGGRVVGIVSHVTELRQRIPAQVHVRKSRTGSKVEVTVG
jgi:DNA repair protein SbcC/Rad50